MTADSFTCLMCGAVSHNPNDIRERYCGRCHAFVNYAPEGHDPLSCLYTLDADNKVIKPKSYLEWGQFMATDRTSVAVDRLKGAVVSTVFLGVDIGWARGLVEPLLFETAIFKDRNMTCCMRTVTWDDAVATHKRTVEAYNEGMGL